ncbi:MAG: hypothetical protein ACRDNL_16890 [Spirillospora sp.]
MEQAPAGSVYLGANDEPVRVRDASKVMADEHGALVQDWDPEDARRYWNVMVDALMLDQVTTNAKARAELGWTPHRHTLLDELATRQAAASQ